MPQEGLSNSMLSHTGIFKGWQAVRRDGCRGSTGAALKEVVSPPFPRPSPLALSCQHHHSCGHTVGCTGEATQLKASNGGTTGFWPGWSTSPVLHVAVQNSSLQREAMRTSCQAQWQARCHPCQSSLGCC